MNAASEAAVRKELPTCKLVGPGRSGVIPALAALVVLLSLLSSLFPGFGADVFASSAGIVHDAVELLNVSGIIAIFSVSWYAPREEYRLRPTLVASLCLPIALFGMLHLMLHPGMPSAIPVADADACVRYFCAVGRLCLPLVLFALILAPRHGALSLQLRWSLLLAMLAGAIPFIWQGIASPAALSDALLKDDAAAHAAIFLLYVGVLYVVSLRRHGLNHPETRNVVLAAILGGMGELCLAFAVPGEPGMSYFAGHLFRALSIGAMFAAAYGESIDMPHRAMEQSHVAALLDRERLEAAFRAIADGIVVVGDKLEVISINPVARHILRCADEIVIGLELPQMLSAMDAPSRQALVRDVEACLREGSPQLSGEQILWMSEAGLVALQHTASPVRDQAGRVCGAVLGVRDVSERWRMSHELLESAGYARRLIEASVDPMFVLDEDGRISDANASAETITGMGREALLGTDFAERFVEPGQAREVLREMLAPGSVRDRVLVLAGADGRHIEVSCGITVFSDPGGGGRGVFVVARDITDLRQAQLQMEFQASCDALTALPNRRLFHERMEHSMALGRRNQRLTAVMLLDIDDFKDINETRGHGVGDELLKTIGDRLRQCVRESDTVARLGGDEFGILMEDLAGPADVQTLADKLIETVELPIRVDGSEIVVSCSIGITLHPLDSGDAETLMRNADTALYRAKGAGKGCYQYYTADMNATVQRRAELAAHLRNALARGELSLHYQPKYHLRHAAVVGVEALLRWNSEQLGAVSPAEFVPIAEDTGLILPIGAWALREACRQAAAWRKEASLEVAVAVNLSARQFRDAGLASIVERALADAGLPARLLELEITESVLMRDADRAREIIAGLKERGIRIAIDDFGTGYSSLAYLKAFPLDYLKIDRSFVTDVPGNANAEAIVRSIAALAHSLGLQVIAEGVETAGQLAFLRELGCDEIQGYYLSRPRPAAQLLEFLLKRPRPRDGEEEDARANAVGA